MNNFENKPILKKKTHYRVFKETLLRIENYLRAITDFLKSIMAMILLPGFTFQDFIKFILITSIAAKMLIATAPFLGVPLSLKVICAEYIALLKGVYLEFLNLGNSFSVFIKELQQEFMKTEDLRKELSKVESLRESEKSLLNEEVNRLKNEISESETRLRQAEFANQKERVLNLSLEKELSIKKTETQLDQITRWASVTFTIVGGALNIVRVSALLYNWFYGGGSPSDSSGGGGSLFGFGRRGLSDSERASIDEIRNLNRAQQFEDIRTISEQRRDGSMPSLTNKVEDLRHFSETRLEHQSSAGSSAFTTSTSTSNQTQDGDGTLGISSSPERYLMNSKNSTPRSSNATLTALPINLASMPEATSEVTFKESIESDETLHKADFEQRVTTDLKKSMKEATKTLFND